MGYTTRLLSFKIMLPNLAPLCVSVWCIVEHVIKLSSPKCWREGGGCPGNAHIVVVEACVIFLAHSKYIFWDPRELSCGDKYDPP